jgi:hypothetical protein
MNTNMDQRSKYTFMQRYNKIWTQIKDKKWKLNVVAEKENTRWTMRVKNGVFLANEKQGNFFKRNLLGSNHLLQKTKLNKTEN